MPNTFSCKRCGHSSKYKGNLIKHLQNKTICEPINQDIPRETLIDEIPIFKNNTLLNPTTYGCNYCNKQFNHVSNKYKHEKICSERNRRITLTKEELYNMNNKTNPTFQTIQGLQAQINDLKNNENSRTLTDKIELLETQINEIKNTKKITRVSPNAGYLYIIHLREFITQDLPVYKIGRATDMQSRLTNYPKNSKIYYFVHIDNVIENENKLINILKTEDSGVLQQTQYGREYFLGDHHIIKTHIDSLFNK